MQLKLAESRGVEPHPISENLVFKASRRTIPAALLSINLVSLPGFEPGPHDPKSCTQPDNALER